MTFCAISVVSNDERGGEEGGSDRGREKSERETVNSVTE